MLLRWTNPREIELLKAFVRRFLSTHEYKELPMVIPIVGYRPGHANEMKITINSERIYGTPTFWTTFDEDNVIENAIAAMATVCEKERHWVSIGWNDQAKRFYLRHGIHKEYVDPTTNH